MEAQGIALIILLAGITVFQLMLALGLPFGKVAWGGKNPGKLPILLRFASLASAGLFAFAMVVVLAQIERLDLLPGVVRQVFLWLMVIHFTIGAVINAISGGKWERLWAPYSAVMAVLSLLLVL